MLALVHRKTTARTTDRERKRKGKSCHCRKETVQNGRFLSWKRRVKTWKEKKRNDEIDGSQGKRIVLM